MGSGEEGETAYYDVGTEEIGSASAGTPIAADDITEWSAGTAPSLTVTSTAVGTSVTAPTGTAATAAVSNGTLTLTNSSTPVTSVTLNTSNIGSASNWSAGTIPSLSYTSRSIPNISVTPTTVVTSLTPSGTLVPNIYQDNYNGLVIDHGSES